MSGASDYARVERAIRFIEARASEQPPLAAIAAEVGLSEFHFQRLFRRWAGVSPKRFLQFLTVQEAKRLLDESRTVLDTSLEVGLSGPGRLHDLFVSLERMTPGEYKASASGLTVEWDLVDTVLGPAMVAALRDAICAVSFVDGEAEARAALADRWPGARLVQARRTIRPHAELLRGRLRGRADRPLSLLLRGSPLQLQVWEALLRIPTGRVASYGDVARLAGAPAATRAVASAVADNAIACLIPCHRVIRSTGAFGEYRWGAARKIALLGLEQARSPAR